MKSELQCSIANEIWTWSSHNNKRKHIIFSKDHTEFAYYVKVEFDLFIQGGWTWKPISIEVT